MDGSFTPAELPEKGRGKIGPGREKTAGQVKLVSQLTRPAAAVVLWSLQATMYAAISGLFSNHHLKWWS